MRKKRLWYMIISGVLLISAVMAGCGAKKNSVPEEGQAVSAAAESVSVGAGAESAETEAAAPDGEAAGVFEEKVLLDTDAVKVVLTDAGEFVPDQEDAGTTKTADPKVQITFDVTNKGDEEIVVDMRDVKLGDESVRRILLKGNIVSPGETMAFQYGILAKEEPETEGAGETAEQAHPLLWETVSEQGLTGIVHVLNISEEIAQAEFSIP